jgi:pimeloyl-ACP methyl ester carboxylesterase
MTIKANAINLFITLKDGRQLGYSEYGFKTGFPILFFHGLPGSRLEAEKLHFAALKLNIRLIGIDRPGMGLSSPQKNRTIINWSEDIKELASILNLGKISIIGHSGGAPYIAACAYFIPEIIHQAVIVSGIAPLTIPEAVSSLPKSQKQMLWMIKYCPFIFKLMMKKSFKAIENPDRLQSMIKQLPEVDANLFKNMAYKKTIASSLKEAFSQDASNVVTDFKLLLKPWGFHLEKIKCPLIVWQGGKDQQAPVKHAEIYAAMVPKTKYMYLKEEGHISILHNYAEQILASALN